MKFKKTILSTVALGASLAPIASVVACGKHDYTDQVATVVTDPENPRWKKADSAFANFGQKLFGKEVDHAILKTQQEQNSWLDARTGKKSYILGTTDDAIGEFIKKIDDTTKAPIIAYDKLIDVDSSNYNWYVAYDNAKIGNLQGLAIVKNLYGATDTDLPWNLNFSKQADKDKVKDFVAAHQLKEEEIILAVGGDPKDNNAGLFYSGAKEVLDIAKAADNSHFLFNLDGKVGDDPEFSAIGQEGWDYNKGLTFLKDKIGALADKKSKIKAILCPNDLMAVTAAMPALQNYNLEPKNVYLTGLDANEKGVDSIKADTGLNMTISKPDTYATQLALNLAKELIAKPDLAPADAETKLKADCPDVDNPWVIDTNSYKTKSNKVINTVLLAPVVITKNNLSDLKD